MGEIFSAAGNVASASIAASAQKKATSAQIKALERQRSFVFEQLEPSRINEQATAADIDRARSRLALQAITDPALLRARYSASEALAREAEQIGAPGTETELVRAQAVADALGQGTTGTAAQLKQRLIDQALTELDAGATLPGDVQAELVRAGLERAPRGMGQNLTRQLIGQQAIALQSERQRRALELTGAAEGLERNRNALLTSLFPALQQSQAANLDMSQAALQASAGQLPQAGLSGESIANIWLARVGATNQLAQAAADAAARGGQAQAQAWQTGLGAATNAFGQALPTTRQTYQSIFGTQTPQTYTGYGGQQFVSSGNMSIPVSGSLW